MALDFQATEELSVQRDDDREELMTVEGAIPHVQGIEMDGNSIPAGTVELMGIISPGWFGFVDRSMLSRLPLRRIADESQTGSLAT
jgi:hypothetical protein